MPAIATKLAPPVPEEFGSMPPESALITQVITLNFSTIAPGDFVCPSHLHHFHQLDVILDGHVQIQLGSGPPLEARRGTVVLIPPLCRHAYRAQQGFDQISFKFHLAPFYWAHFGSEHRSLKLSPARLQEFLRCGRRLENGGLLANQQALALATLCLVAFVETASPATRIFDEENPLLPYLWPLLEAIEAHPYENWTVAALARECHLSTDYFSRLFHQLLDTTPQRYLLSARMRAAAAELINQPERTIKQIAEDSGYANVHAFTRAFKTVLHTSPAAYRHTPRQL